MVKGYAGVAVNPSEETYKPQYTLAARAETVMRLHDNTAAKLGWGRHIGCRALTEGVIGLTESSFPYIPVKRPKV